MCLGIVYRGERKEVALAKLPKLGYYWKVVGLRKKKGKIVYCPPVYPECGYFVTGWNTTEPKKDIWNDYLLAYHLFRTKRGAKKMASWICGKYRIVRCKVERKDIINIGLDDGSLTIVTKRIWIPKPKKKLAT